MIDIKMEDGLNVDWVDGPLSINDYDDAISVPKKHKKAKVAAVAATQNDEPCLECDYSDYCSQAKASCSSFFKYAENGKKITREEGDTPTRAGYNKIFTDQLNIKKSKRTRKGSLK